MKHKRLLVSFEVIEGDCTHLDVEVYYDKGGMNYFTGNLERRGLYLSVQPLTKSAQSIGFTAFSGVKKLVKEVGRYSHKALAEFVVDYETMNSMVEHVVQKNNLKLAIQQTKLELS